MKRTPRRLALQLVSLFDLLMIVVFAQFLDVKLTADREVGASRRDTERAQAEKNELQIRADELARLLAEVEAVRKKLVTDLESAQASAIRETELQAELVQVRNNLLRLGDMTAAMFRAPRESLDKVLTARSPPEAAEVRKQLEQLAAARGADVVRHLLTLAELQKRADIWDLRIGDDNVVQASLPGGASRFRADSAERFEVELFRLYKSAPQPKSLVIILLSWGDADFAVRRAATDGLARGVEHMTNDTDRRSRFEYAVLGYLPVTSLVEAPESQTP